jgi:hypothetical protein
MSSEIAPSAAANSATSSSSYRVYDAFQIAVTADGVKRGDEQLRTAGIVFIFREAVEGAKLSMTRMPGRSSFRNLSMTSSTTPSPA